MLKSVLASWALFVTGFRLADMIFIFIKGGTNLPIPVFFVTGAMICYGAVLLAKRVLGNVTLRQWMFFYSVQTAAILFNLFYVAKECLFEVSVAEMFIVGTFLDVLINMGFLYLSTKQRRKHYFAIATPEVTGRRA